MKNDNLQLVSRGQMILASKDLVKIYGQILSAREITW